MITRDELIEIQRQLDGNKVWGGMAYVYHPVPYFKYKKVLDIINRELNTKQEVKSSWEREIDRQGGSFSQDEIDNATAWR
jgi:hypothetical protein